MLKKTLVILLILIILTGILYFYKEYNKNEKFRQGKICADCSKLDSFSKCYDCEDCVWCSDNKKCMKGDASGPYFENCNNFKHRDDFRKLLDNRNSTMLLF